MDKLKSIWKSKSKKGFKGSGHVLGTTGPEAPAAASKTQSRQASGQKSSSQQPSSSQALRPAPGKRLGTAPETAGPKSQPSPPHKHAQASPTQSQSRSSYDASASKLPSTSYGPDTASDDIQDAVALLRCDDRPGAPAVSILTRLLRNIANSPSDPKYRRLRLQNPKIKEAVVDIAGGIELLQACGFDLIFEPAEGTAEEEGFAVLPETADVSDVCSALYLLSPNEPRSAPAPSRLDSLWSPSPPSTSASTSTAAPASTPAAATASSSAASLTSNSKPAQPRPRNTQVLIPADAETEVADWVFERSPAELKSALMAARRKKEQSEMLMTRAMRERLALGDRRSTPTWGTVRVRMPEGLLLQAEFAALEPCAAVFAWLTDCLQDPGETYRLVQPRAGTLEPSQGTVRDAGLLPSVLLHFQRQGRERERLPALSQALLAQAQPAL